MRRASSAAAVVAEALEVAAAEALEVEDSAVAAECLGGAVLTSIVRTDRYITVSAIQR